MSEWMNIDLRRFLHNHGNIAGEENKNEMNRALGHLCAHIG